MDERGRAVQTKTVVFTDVTASTALRSDLGDDEADAVALTLHRLQERVVGEHGGVVVKSLGDGLMATFDGAAAAIAAAIDIQAGARELGRRGTVRSELRVGVSTGDVSTTDDGDHFGTPVVEAARLCDAAASGQILIADVVRVLAGSRTTGELVDHGPLELKGLPDPLATWEVRWDDAVASRPSLPSALHIEEGFPFVGRSDERAVLDAAWARARAGVVELVVVSGEPGAGKTRLTAELARDLLGDGATLLFGTCEDGLGVPHQPFVECIRDLLARPGTPRLGAQAGELVRLVPDIASLVPGLPPPLQSDPETERYQLFNAVADLLADVARDGPVVLVLDDLHWATAPTLQLLRHVVRARLAAPVLIVGIFRSTDVDEAHPLTQTLAELHRTTTIHRVELPGLDAEAVRSYLEGIAGYQLDDRADELARRVHAETDGNPFFMREVLLHLVESRQLYVVDGRWETAEGYLDAVPDRARDVITQRLARLGDGTRTLLVHAAVVGPEFELGLLASVAGVDEDDALEQLEQAVAARLVQEIGVDRYRFTHALVRSALVDGLSASRRARYHRQVAEALESRPGVAGDAIEEIADHWLAAGEAGDPAKAIDFTRRAAQRAADQVAHDEAAALLATAVGLADRSGLAAHDAAELRADLGAAQQRAGDPQAHDTLVDAFVRARALGDVDLMVRTNLADARMAAVLEADPERVARVEEVLAALGPEPSSARARLLANLGFELSFTGDRDRSTDVLDDALAMARTGGDPSALAYVLSMRVNTFRWADTEPECLAACEEIESISERLDDPAMHFLAAYRRSQILLRSGGTRQFRESIATMTGLVDRLGQPLMAWNLARRRSELALLDGDLDAAELAAVEVRKRGHDLQLPNTEPIYIALAAKIHNLAGAADRSVALWESWVDRIHMVGFSFGLAQAQLLVGQRDAAADRWEAAVPDDFADLPHDPQWLETMAIAADVACDLGDRVRAGQIADALEGHPTLLVTSGVGAICSTDHALGVARLGAGDLDAAEVALQRSVEFCRQADAPLLVAQSRMRLAQVLLARGETASAEPLLRKVIATAERYGARGLVAAVERLVPDGVPGA